MTITAQATWSPSEQPIVSEGWFYRRYENGPITANPHPAVCQQSLRDHWLWEQGWYQADTMLAFNKI
jgi:hypothetical protein